MCCVEDYKTTLNVLFGRLAEGHNEKQTLDEVRIKGNVPLHCLSNQSEARNDLSKVRLALTFLCLLFMQGPQLFLLLEKGLQLLDLLVVVLPLRDDPHSGLQFGLLSHRIVTLQTQQAHRSGVRGEAACIYRRHRVPRGMRETE